MIRVVSLKNDLHFVVFWSLRLGFISGQNRVFDIVRKCILGAGRIMCFNFWCLYPDLWWLNNIKGATQLHLYNAPSKKAQYKKYKKRYKYAYSYICAYTHTHTHTRERHTPLQHCSCQPLYFTKPMWTVLCCYTHVVLYYVHVDCTMLLYSCCTLLCPCGLYYAVILWQTCPVLGICIATTEKVYSL